MMPLAKPPFDMICIGCCTCTEYIQAAQEQPSSKEASVERREAQRVANGRGAVRTAGRTGVGSGRWGACVGGDGSSVVSARSNQGSSSAGAGGAKTRREGAFGRGGQVRPSSAARTASRKMPEQVVQTQCSESDGARGSIQARTRLGLSLR